MADDENNDEPRLFGHKVPTKRAPLWVRIILWMLLILLAGIGFYYTNQVTFDRVLNR